MIDRRRLRLAALVVLAPWAALAAPPTVGGCPVFPADNYWNAAVDTLPLHPSSSAWVGTIGNAAHLHADWGNVLADNFGIPFVTVTGAQPLVPITNYTDAPPPFTDPGNDFSDESDPGPYPIPPTAPVEGGADNGGDQHVLVIETTHCVLYELYRAHFNALPDNSWVASSYAKWPLNSNALRPADWTSADAAGLPIFPGLVRYDEAASGSIEHAIRFTAASIWGRDAATGHITYLWPARHNSGASTTATRPPMGARFRLKASYNIPPTFSPLTQTILRAMKKYGLVLADGGSNWFFQGVSDTRWPDAVFSEIASVAGSNFEAVDTARFQVSADSAQTGAIVDPPRLANISTRMQVLTGSSVMIGGFIIGGSVSKTVAITATGPSLAPFGIANFLANPTLTLVRSSDQSVIATNDDWQTDVNASQLLASGFAPGNALEPGLLVNLPPGAYTAIVSGAGGTTGVSVIGVFEVDHPEAPLANISTRGFVQTGGNVMIGGFIVQGGAPRKVAITATGPSLAPFGISNFLANPTLQVVRQSDGATIATNDDWQTDVNAAQLQASGFAPGNALEPGVLLTLPPGAYTAIVSGVGGTTGVSVIGVFTAP